MSASGTRRIKTALMIAGLGAFLTSCTTLQVPVSGPSFPLQEVLRGSREGVEIGVTPIVAEDEYLQLFDDDLPEIGIAALWVEVHNTRSTAIEMNPVGWHLRTSGQESSSLSIEEVFARYYQGRKVRMYAIGTDGTARLNMERVIFRPGPIQPAAKRQGFVFFRLNPAIPSGWNRGATLGVDNIWLDRSNKINLEIALSHANP
jgi:hypothetical protein